jgi:hypothetical protein
MKIRTQTACVMKNSIPDPARKAMTRQASQAQERKKAYQQHFHQDVWHSKISSYRNRLGLLPSSALTGDGRRRRPGGSVCLLFYADKC